MAHGKETPRQKMIGMMYLVLTAMLALNVSKDVLNAFTLVDMGLTTTTENFTVKNKGLYDRFAVAYEQNPTKVGDWKEKADELHRRSDELFEFINDPIMPGRSSQYIINIGTDHRGNKTGQSF